MKPFDYYTTYKSQYPRKKDYIIQGVVDDDSYKKHQKEYYAEKNKLQQEFQNDLFEEYNVSDNPKRFKCFDLAWDHGHPYGMIVVYEYFGDFVELIKDT